MHNPIEKKCLGIAAAQALCFTENQDSIDEFYSSLMEIVELVEEGIDPGCALIREDFDHMTWSDVLGLIYLEAQFIEEGMVEVLELAKKGLIKAAIDATLDSDMTQLDMRHMVEQGELQDAADGQ